MSVSLPADHDFFTDALRVIASWDHSSCLSVDGDGLRGTKAVVEKFEVHVVLESDHHLVLLVVACHVGLRFVGATSTNITRKKKRKKLPEAESDGFVPASFVGVISVVYAVERLVVGHRGGEVVDVGVVQVEEVSSEILVSKSGKSIHTACFL